MDYKKEINKIGWNSKEVENRIESLIDDGFISRMGSVFGRSLATGKTMGIMRLGKGLSSKFGNTMLGKVVKGGLNIMDTAISHIPFIKTPYKMGKAGFKGLSSITSGISKMGVSGNTYIDYTAKALKEGYKPSEIMKDIGSDIVGNVKNSKLGQTASSIKNSKTTKRTCAQAGASGIT